MTSATDPPLQERVYDGLKRDYLAGLLEPGSRLDILEIADRHRSSRTPAREALCRLMGEGLIEAHPKGGLRLTQYSPAKLIQLHKWNMSLTICLAKEIGLSALRGALERAAPASPIRSSLDVSLSIAKLFVSLAHATGNEFAVASIKNMNERLHYVRMEEVQYLPDVVHEIMVLTNPKVSDVRKSMRRRLEGYHARRIVHLKPKESG